jgi:hypothetical protein
MSSSQFNRYRYEWGELGRLDGSNPSVKLGRSARADGRNELMEKK